MFSVCHEPRQISKPRVGNVHGCVRFACLQHDCSRNTVVDPSLLGRASGKRLDTSCFTSQSVSHPISPALANPLACSYGRCSLCLRSCSDLKACEIKVWSSMHLGSSPWPSLSYYPYGIVLCSWAHCVNQQPLSNDIISLLAVSIEPVVWSPSLLSDSDVTHVLRRRDESSPLEFLVSHRALGLNGDLWHYVWTSERCCQQPNCILAWPMCTWQFLVCFVI
jgi:hypothetical protein